MKKIDHIGIAVKDLKKSNFIYENILGIAPYKEETLELQSVKASFFKVNNSKIELIEAIGDDSKIAKFIKNKGEGIHHIAFLVDDIYEEMKRLVKLGFKLVNNVPKKGADNKLICFIYPKKTSGVLIEICQEIIKN